MVRLTIVELSRKRRRASAWCRRLSSNWIPTSQKPCAPASPARPGAVGRDQTILQLGGTQNDNFIPQSKNSFNFIGRSIFFNQVSGDHRNLKDSKVRLRWTAVGATGKRDEPESERNEAGLPIIGTFQQGLYLVMRDGKKLRVAEVPDPEGGNIYIDMQVDFME